MWLKRGQLGLAKSMIQLIETERRRVVVFMNGAY